MSDYEYKKIVSEVIVCTLVGFAFFFLMPIWFSILAGALIVLSFFVVGYVIVEIFNGCREILRDKDKH